MNCIDIAPVPRTCTSSMFNTISIKYTVELTDSRKSLSCQEDLGLF